MQHETFIGRQCSRTADQTVPEGQAACHREKRPATVPTPFGRRLAILVSGLLVLLATAPGAFADGVPISLESALERAFRDGTEGALLQAGEQDARLQYEEAMSALRWGLDSGLGYERSGDLLRLEDGERQDLSDPTDSFSASLDGRGPRSSLGLRASHRIVPDSTRTAGNDGVPDNQNGDDNADRDHRSTLGLSGSYDIYDGYPGGRPEADRLQAEYERERREIGLESDRQALETDVTEAYLAVQGAVAQREGRELSLDQRQDEFERTEVLYDMGEIPRTDLLQAEINLLEAEENLRQANWNEEQTMSRLARLTGYPAGTRFAPEPVDIDTGRPVELDEAIAEALTNRTDLRENEIARELQEIRIELTRADRRPTLDIDGNVSLSQDWSDDVLDVDWSVGLQLSIPVIDRGTRSARTEQAELGMEELRIRREQLVESIRQGVRTAARNLEAAEHEVHVSELRLEQTRNQAERARQEYEDGEAPRSEWLRAQVEVSSAEVALEQARTDLKLEAIAFDRALGR